MGLFDDFFRRGREGAQRAKGQTAKPTTQQRGSSPTQQGPTQQTSPAQGAQAQAQRTYIVQSGDTLSAIAKRFYGDASAYMRIFEANRDVLRDPDVIQPGQTLKIP